MAIAPRKRARNSIMNWRVRLPNAALAAPQKVPTTNATCKDSWNGLVANSSAKKVKRAVKTKPARNRRVGLSVHCRLPVGIVDQFFGSLASVGLRALQF